MNKIAIITGISIFLLIAGFFLLRMTSIFLIREIVQPVVLEERAVTEDSAGVGEKAPHFALPDFSGAIVSPSDFLGMPLLIVFWTTWNGASVDQLRILDEYSAQNGKALFKIISINNQEDAGAVANFIRRGGYRVPVLLDETGAVGEQYRVTTVPVLYFLDAGGIMRSVVSGAMSGNMVVEKFETMLR